MTTTTGRAAEPALARATASVRARLLDAAGPVTSARIAEAARAAGVVWAGADLAALVEEVRADLVGLGPLESLAADPEVTDVVVNGPQAVYVDRGRGLEPAAVRFADDAAVVALGRRLAAAVGRRLDESVPWVDVRLPDGARLHALLPPVASPGPCLSLRLPRRGARELDDLVSPGVAALLRDVVAARLPFLVTGGTGSGKTTLLAALLGCVPPVERLVLVEDPRELRPRHPHVVALEARPPNVEGAGEVTLRQLVRQALRMRPDRLVVGEVRGAEVVDLLAALNTGHEGGCGTLHANGPAQLPARVEALAGAGGLGREAAHSQLAAALRVVVHVGRDRDGRRGVREVGVPRRGPSGLVEVVTAAVVDAHDVLQPAAAATDLRRMLS